SKNTQIGKSLRYAVFAAKNGMISLQAAIRLAPMVRASQAPHFQKRARTAAERKTHLGRCWGFLQGKKHTLATRLRYVSRHIEPEDSSGNADSKSAARRDMARLSDVAGLTLVPTVNRIRMIFSRSDKPHISVRTTADYVRQVCLTYILPLLAHLAKQPIIPG